jgi:hypothetical protein
LVNLVSAGNATGANVELFNNGAAGTFDVELDLHSVGSPVGSLLGSFTQTGINSVGSDVIDLSFNLGGGVAVPQNLVFVVRVSNLSSNMDLGLDMFEPPTVGSSDNTFMIAESAPNNFFEIPTNNENVYFQLSGDIANGVPEPSSVGLMGLGLIAVGMAWMRRGRREESRRGTQSACATS